MIELNGVSISLGKTPILHDIHLQVTPGTVYGLLGPSGAGKTTAVKIAAGILRADRGDVQIAGQRMPSLVGMAAIGYMAQEDALYADLTGRQNLEFFGAMYRMEKKAMAERIDYVLNLVNLTNDGRKLVSKYSGGMRRRLALAAAVLHDPEVLLLDEPTVGIDPVLRRDLWAELYRIAAAGKTILVTTHVMDEAEKCHRLAMLRDGRVIGEGSPAELKAQYNLTTIEEVFLRLSDGKGGDAA